MANGAGKTRMEANLKIRKDHELFLEAYESELDTATSTILMAGNLVIHTVLELKNQLNLVSQLLLHAQYI